MQAFGVFTLTIDNALAATPTTMTVATISAVDAGLLCIFVYLVTGSLVRGVASKRTAKPQPPGPPGAWFFGNAYQIPSDRQWLKFDEWIRAYGESHFV